MNGWQSVERVSLPCQCIQQGSASPGHEGCHKPQRCYVAGLSFAAPVRMLHSTCYTQTSSFQLRVGGCRSRSASAGVNIAELSTGGLEGEPRSFAPEDTLLLCPWKSPSAAGEGARC